MGKHCSENTLLSWDIEFCINVEHSSLLQVVTIRIILCLKEQYTGIINLSYTATKWRETNVEFVPKSGRSSHIETKESFILKTLEMPIDS